ncbi:MAG: decarboxylase, partial [Gemmatimonadetes bacterium]|nr:decarboxylase [Gemmatimonadota bacterium]
KVWVSIQTFGMAAFRSAVAKGMELAARAESYVRGSPNLEVVNPASLGIVCFRVNPEDTDLDEDALDKVNRTVLSRVFWDERAFISSTLLHRTFALRLCILNHTTTWNDVQETLDAVEQFGKEALAGVA